MDNYTFYKSPEIYFGELVTEEILNTSASSDNEGFDFGDEIEF